MSIIENENEIIYTPESEDRPQVGQRVRVISNIMDDADSTLVNGLPDLVNGRYGVLEWDDHSRLPYRVVMDRDGGAYGGVGVWCRKVAAVPETEAALEPEQEAQQRIRELEQALETEKQRHAADIALIGQRLNDESLSRSRSHIGNMTWCEAYDEVVSELNEELAVPLPPRMLDWDVSVRVERVRWVTVTVRAHDEDDARREVAEGEHNEAIRSALDDERSFDSGNYEVEVEGVEES